MARLLEIGTIVPKPSTSAFDLYAFRGVDLAGRHLSSFSNVELLKLRLIADPLTLNRVVQALHPDCRLRDLQFTGCMDPHKVEHGLQSGPQNWKHLKDDMTSLLLFGNLQFETNMVLPGASLAQLDLWAWTNPDTIPSAELFSQCTNLRALSLRHVAPALMTIALSTATKIEDLWFTSRRKLSAEHVHLLPTTLRRTWFEVEGPDFVAMTERLACFEDMKHMWMWGPDELEGNAFDPIVFDDEHYQQQALFDACAKRDIKISHGGRALPRDQEDGRMRSIYYLEDVDDSGGFAGGI